MTSLISGFIFDIDGTLLDSTPAHISAWQSILHEVGLKKSNAEILQHFGKRTAQIARELIQGETTAEQIKYRNLSVRVCETLAHKKKKLITRGGKKTGDRV